LVDNLVLLALSYQVLLHALDHFLAVCNEKGMKISIEKNDALCLYRNPNHLQVASNH